MSISSQDILKVLSTIIDPESNQNIVSLGLIKNLNVVGKDVTVNIELPMAASASQTNLQDQVKKLIKAIPNIDVVTVNLISHEAPRVMPAPAVPDVLGKVKSIIAVSSCKGGVGKSTVAAHLALTLAGRGYKVGLIDADIYGPSVPTLLNLQQATVSVNAENQFIPIEKNDLKVMSFGFLLGDAPAVLRGPIVTRYIQQLLLNTAWGELDYLFIDMPPGTGDVQLTITQSVRLSGAVIVTTRQTLSLVDVSRGILMFEKVDVPILGIIENMSYFICDNCDKKHYIFGGEKASGLQERFGIETLAEVPLLPQLSLTIDKPMTNSYISEAADKMIASLKEHKTLQKQVPDIKFDAKNIYLNWKDGTHLTILNRDLRASCQCALCINEMTGEQILKKDRIKSDIAPKKITPLGNYAIGIDWNDGHSSGIYPYRTIRQLATIAK